MNSSLQVDYRSHSSNRSCKSPIDSEGRQYKANRANLTTFMGVMVLSGATQGYIDYSNQAACLYNAQYGWEDETKIARNQQVIGASIILGCTIGAALAGKLVQYGRRQAHFIACFAGMFGVLFTLFRSFQLQLLGRLIYGLAAGLQSVVSPRFIEEFVPLDSVGTCIAIFTFAQNLGLLSCLLIAAILPADDDLAGLEANESWRVIFGLPILTYTLILIALVFLIPYDSPKYYVASGQQEEAVKSIHRMYNTGGSEENARRIYNHVNENSATETLNVSLAEAFVTDEMHRRASWVAVAIIVFSELTGF